MIKPSILVMLIALTLSSSSLAFETELLPTSRHQQSQTYGLFTDQQSSLVMRNEGRAWGAVGGNLAFLEVKDWQWKPQLIMHGLASASFRLNSRGDTLLTDTMDARVGLAVDLEFTDDTRASIMWTHQSGHIADNVPDTDLIGSNLGNEVLTLRVIHDCEKKIRIGGALRPIMGSEPRMKAFGAEQFFEYFFRGQGATPHEGAPYVALGGEEFGLNKIDFTFHAQFGWLIGNHFGPQKFPSIRAVLGYYNGVDPRMKYYQFKNRYVQFGYAGLMFDL